jgi:hypothetical protein
MAPVDSPVDLLQKRSRRAIIRVIITGRGRAMPEHGFVGMALAS